MITKSSLHRLFFSLVAFLLLATIVTSAPVSAAGGADYELTDKQFMEFKEFIVETDNTYPEYTDGLFSTRLSTAEYNQERLIKELDLYEYKSELTNLDQAKIDYLSSILEQEETAMVTEQKENDKESYDAMVVFTWIGALCITIVIIVWVYEEIINKKSLDVKE